MALEEEGNDHDEGEVVMVESGLKWGAPKGSCGRNWGCGYETMGVMWVISSGCGIVGV